MGEIEGGVEFRSRLWMGYHIEEGKPVLRKIVDVRPTLILHNSYLSTLMNKFSCNSKLMCVKKYLLK